MDIISVISVLVFVGLVFSVAFLQLSILAWTVLLGVGLVLISIFGHVPLVLLLIFWLGYLMAASFANLHVWRQRYIVKPMVTRLQAQMPSISATEHAAIEAGDTWWEKDLFCGRPDWKKLFAIPRPSLSTEEQNFIDNQVETLCGMVKDWEVCEQHDLPEQVWQYLKNEKFLGIVIPKQYGGLGFSALLHSTVVTKLASRSVSAAVTTMVPNSLGPAELLLHYGTEEQKNYYLPRLASGLEIPCFGLTGPDAGSDAGAIPDSGIICRDIHEGKETLGIRLNWDKRYITLAPITTLLGIAFHLYDPDKLLSDKVNLGITLCLIPASHPGVQIGHRHYPMHLAFMNGPTRGKDVFIPLDWIIGGVDMVGQGWRMLMECLSIGRSISLPALATGSGKVAYRFTGAYARIRRQFNVPIATFEGVEEALGYIAGHMYTLDACRMMTAGAIDLNINPSTVSAIAKYHMTEMCRRVINHAMDIHGGHAIQMGPRNLLAGIYLAIPISITVEGANILTRNLIIFGQGAIRCHPYILKEVELISAKEVNVPELDKTLMAHIGYFAGNLLRTFAYGLTGGKFIFASIKNSRIKKYQRQLTRMSAALALLADLSLILLGGSLKRRERVSARLGDLLSQLYLASTVLKFYNDNNRPNSDVDNVCWSLQYSLSQMQMACDELLNNFPYRILGKLFQWIIFPWGRAYKLPSDKLQTAIIAPMLTNSELRDRLTKYCYVGTGNDPGAQLDKALQEVGAVEPIWKKLHKAVQNKTIPHWFTFEEQVRAAEEAGVLSADEARIISQFEVLRREIIKVNEFSFNLDTVIA